MITHILSGTDWDQAQVQGVYRAQIDVDGFIHCSTPEQVIGTANRYYPGRTDLLLLWIDPERVQAEVRWEASDGKIFPHIYGPLNLEAVVRVTELHPDANGMFAQNDEGESFSG